MKPKFEIGQQVMGIHHHKPILGIITKTTHSTHNFTYKVNFFGLNYIGVSEKKLLLYNEDVWNEVFALWKKGVALETSGKEQKKSCLRLLTNTLREPKSI